MTRSIVSLLLALALAGCSGGGGVSPTPAPTVEPTAAPHTAATSKVTISVQLPSAGTTAAKRLPAYVSTGTTQIAIFTAPLGQSLNLETPQTAQCLRGTCIISINVPTGQDVFEIGLLNGASSYLSIAFTVAQINPGVANTITVTFQGVPATLVLTPVSSAQSFSNGIASSVTASATVEDATGEIIATQTPLWNAISLTTTPSAGFTITPATLTPGITTTNGAGSLPNLVTLSYDGTPTTSATVAVSASTGSGNPALSVTGASYPVASGTPSFSTISQIGVNVATQQSGATWLGYIPAAATLQSAVAGSTVQPSSLTDFESRGTGTFAISASNSTAPFSVTRRTDAVPMSPSSARIDTSRFVSDEVAGEPDTAALRQHGRPLSGAHRTALAARRVRSLTVGATQSFYINNASITGLTTGSQSYISVPFKLGTITTHGAIWIDQTSGTATAQLSQSTIAQIGANFENAWTLDSQYFGSSSYAGSVPTGAFDYPTCDANGNTTNGYDSFPLPDPGYVNVLVTDSSDLGSGLGGYFDSANYYPQDIANCFNAKSNEGPFIVTGWFASDPNEINTFSVESNAHEYQHLVNFVQHSILRGGYAESAFINEGLSQLAQDLTRGNKPTAQTVDNSLMFLAAPQNYSLTAFSGFENGADARGCIGCYGEAYLFMRYLTDRFGTGILANLNQSPQYGLANVAAVTGESASQLLEDFGTMLAVSGTGITPSTNAVTNLQSLPLRGSYSLPAPYSGTVSAAQLTPASISVTPGASAQSVSVQAGGYVFFDLPSIGSSGNAVKVVDQNGNRSLWLGLATK